MIDQEILNFVMRVELWLLAFSVLLFFVHGSWLRFVDARNRRRLAEGRLRLVALLSAEVPDPADLIFLRTLPRRVKTRVFLEISRSLSGEPKERLKFAARDIGLVDTARKFCRSSSWRYRLRGARLLTNLEEPDPILMDLLHDPNPGVRAQAAEWAATNPSLLIIEQMLDLLGDADTLSRFAVQDSLLRMGRVIVEPLAAFLGQRAGDAAEVGLELAEAVAEPTFLKAAFKHAREGSPQVKVAACALLAAIGGDAASSQLMSLLDNDDERVRAISARGLGKMRHWPAATRLSAMLADGNWEVRREAAMALRQIGGPGLLLLRKAAAGTDDRSSAVAQLILDTPIQLA